MGRQDRTGGPAVVRARQTQHGSLQATACPMPDLVRAPSDAGAASGPAQRRVSALRPGYSGNRTVTRVPRSGSLSRSTVPSCPSMSDFTMYRPRPLLRPGCTGSAPSA